MIAFWIELAEYMKGTDPEQFPVDFFYVTQNWLKQKPHYDGMQN